MPSVFQALLLVSTGEGLNYMERCSVNRSYQNLTVTMERFVGYMEKVDLEPFVNQAFFMDQYGRKL
jgi:hypothetical protein